MNLNKILKNQQDYYYSKDMKVKLVSYSQPSKEFQEMGIGNAQDLIAFCARVSNPSNQLNAETSEKLIKYLINHSHWSPLEMVTACLEIETTRDIARQILRHRSFSFQEFSQRYADPTKDLDFVVRETRLQDKKNRQNSIKSENKDLNIEWEKRQKQVINSAIETVVDRISFAKHKLSKQANDLASAAVLIALLSVLLVWGLILF